MTRSALILLFVCLVPVCRGQMYDFFIEDNDWKYHRHHFEFGVGTTNFLGDLGGKDGIGTNDLKDLEWTEFHLAGLAGYRYTFKKWLFGRLDFSYSRIAGDDKLTQEAFRNNRNLHFRSNVFEINLMPEIHLRLGGKRGHQYQIDRVNKNSGPWRIRGSYFSVFGGIGIMHHNPKAKLGGTWYDLRPLRTEGQGLPGGPEEYKLWRLNVPVGFNFMVRVHRQWLFGFEVTYRFTFTDYLDDVSTNYYNPYDLALYQQGTGMEDIAAYLSNPALGLANGGLPDMATAPGQQRGDPRDNDAYFYVMFKADYMLMKQDNFTKRKTKGFGRGRRARTIRPMRF
ncbi:MAG: hypothetical protein JNM00_11310 [Flavobacteriales bacterium]|nr:hypothetical protein [Flavobacteriales bacterium]